MLKTYFKTAWRNLVKNKTFSLINIAGLAVGMAACLLILQYVLFELSYDRFNEHYADIYRVVNDRYQNGKLAQHGTITYSAVGPALKNDYPEVENNVRVEPFREEIISTGDKKIGDQVLLAADNSFLSVFSYPLLAGDRNSALAAPNNVILSESLAGKLFDMRHNDYQSLLGKVVVRGRDSVPCKITGICRDVPGNSHLQFDLLLSYSSLYSGGNGYWKEAEYDFTDSDFWHYIQLKKGTDYKQLEAKLDAFSRKYFQGIKVSGSIEKFSLQPLSRAHLYSDFEYEIGKTGSATVVWGLLIIAVLIMVIAWVNYINLTTAKSMERAKEVGVRKVTGATKRQLMGQFLSESFLINLVAILLALALVWLMQGSFNHLVQQKLSLAVLFRNNLQGYSLTILIVVCLLAGILAAGFYPAFVLSSFKPIVVLKGRFSSSARGIALRKVLVTGQFAVTILLIMGSLVVYRQLRFMNRQQLGLNMDQVLVIRPPVLTTWDSGFIGRVNSFKEEIKQIAYVKGAATSRRVPGEEMGRAFDIQRTDKNSDTRLVMRNMGMDADFIRVYGIQLLAGRNFSAPDYNPDWRALHTVILNESAVKQLGFATNEEALGKKIKLFRKDWDIVGVVKDFHQKSLRYAVEPTLLLPTYATNNPISVKISPQNLTATLEAIKTKYAAFFPGNLFDYYFLNEHFNYQYKNEQLFGKVFGLFAALAIVVACLGLLGLSLYAITQRIKEIGVRKVLGASVASLVVLLSKDFIRLVLVSFIIASPLAYYIMHQWLQGFAYRISISWWLFAFTGLTAVTIALCTISIQAIRAALANPVKSLRTE
jgi:putative ABC transport system permease protein